MSVRVCIPISNDSESQRGCYTDEVSFHQLLATLIGRRVQHETIVVGMALAERVYGATGRGCGRYRAGLSMPARYDTRPGCLGGIST
jgi:hypothetical protein